MHINYVLYVCTSRIRAGIQTHDTLLSRESDLPLNYQGSLVSWAQTVVDL